MSTAEALDRGRASFDRQEWTDAYARLAAADREESLRAADLERLATAAYLVGRDSEAADVWARAHHEHLSGGDPQRAARCAFWLGFGLMHLGQHAQGSGWIARARRLLEDVAEECVEQGYLLLPDALRCITAGDPAAARATFGRAHQIGARFGDPDLVTLARHGEGRALLRMGEISEGVALLDEVMVAVTLGEVSPLVVGDIYCGVIEGCHEIFDLRRAQEWTSALSRWCESRPELVPYRGQCLVRRAEILQLHGAWRDAMLESERARERLSVPAGQPAIGAAFYQQAELHRLRGEFADAEEAYRQASQWGRTPRPGPALLRLARGELEAARAAIRRMMDEAQGLSVRAGLLPACVEIMLAARDVAAARKAADELTIVAGALDAPMLWAAAAHAGGAVLLAEGDARGALEALRRAWTAWQELEVPYEAARVRMLIGLTCRALGDRDGADVELDAARRVFRELGAAPALARLEELAAPAAPIASRLTPRELQVLRLVAAGTTNRAIAVELGISEKTVARHVSNIFTKLGLSTRAAATAFAWQHRLV